jgi:hypothetical protein
VHAQELIRHTFSWELAPGVPAADEGTLEPASQSVAA